MNGKRRTNLTIALIYQRDEILGEILKFLVKEFGSFKKEITYNFDFTDYYEEEFGKNLIKKILIFNKIITKEDLIKIKHFTNELEKQFSKDSKRLINIDPGYINKNELILASNKAKDFKEKINSIYLHKIYGFKDNKVETFYHTFSDYKQENVKKFFLDFVTSFVI